MRLRGSMRIWGMTRTVRFCRFESPFFFKKTSFVLRYAFPFLLAGLFLLRMNLGRPSSSLLMAVTPYLSNSNTSGRSIPPPPRAVKGWRKSASFCPERTNILKGKGCLVSRPERLRTPQACLHFAPCCRQLYSTELCKNNPANWTSCYCILPERAAQIQKIPIAAQWGLCHRRPNFVSEV